MPTFGTFSENQPRGIWFGNWKYFNQIDQDQWVNK